ncbi:ArsR/SmtB family transcription factor [uncultured Friedmanniella sp.]|uniref:ArsR/SmtB family transcription factor n=1 Tax=uncultured Friedmanniella sp. TaxID=335381 RepID=UPI0035C9953B
MAEPDDLVALEARIRRLEEHARLTPDDGPVAPHPAADPWWLLTELDRRGLDSALVYAGTVREEAGGPVRWQITQDPAAVLDTDWGSSAATLAALGHPSRLQILQLVARGEARTAAELSAAEGLGTTGQIYHHLRLLVGAGWLRATHRGQHEVPAERLVPLLLVLSAAGTAAG